jgi:hypothetical protein
MFLALNVDNQPFGADIYREKSFLSRSIFNVKSIQATFSLDVKFIFSLLCLKTLQKSKIIMLSLRTCCDWKLLVAVFQEPFLQIHRRES